jgi:hypothetical protein
MESRQLNVQRLSIISQEPFESVVAAVEAAIGKPNMSEFAKEVAGRDDVDPGTCSTLKANLFVPNLWQRIPSSKVEISCVL